ncbi:MAG: glycosyltransferase [Lachnospiraceae bacterium]|nr:glycosyltransferase [Lachnospiraceae bacterium]
MPDAKHIAFYVSSLTRGGTERTFINLAQHLYDQGYRVTFVTSFISRDEYPVPHATWREVSKEEAKLLGEDAVEVMRPDESASFVTFKGVLPAGERGIDRVFSGVSPREQRKLRTVNFSKRTQLARKCFEELKPDLIISANAKNNVMAMLSSIGLDIPVIVCVVANPATEYASRQLYLSMVATFPRAAAVVLQLEAQASFFPPKVRERTIVIRNALDETFLKPPYEGEREKTIVSVGTLNHNKNHQMLVKAFARLLPKYPDWRLVIYGEGNERRHLTQLVGALGIRGTVELPGMRENIAEEIYKAGMFVLCSNEEGMPMTLLEAMAMGIPCISTDCPCGGPREIVKDGFNGLLTPVGDVARMETAMIRFLGNRGLTKSCSGRAPEVRKIFHPDLVYAAWDDLIRRSLNQEEAPEPVQVQAQVFRSDE